MTAGLRRTPDDNFAGLRGFDYPPNYLEWEGLRMHYVDAGPADGQVCMSMSKTRLSSRAQLMRCGRA